MYHFVYKITNNLNGKIYIGIHSTGNLDDGYMGSSKILSKDITKYGKSNFTKEIIKFFDSRKEALLEESIIVDDNFVKRIDTYNINTGGKTNTTGLVPVRDKDGNTLMVRKDDPQYINGEFIHIIKGRKYNFSQVELERRSKQGKSNSNLRRVTNGIENKSVPKEKLDEFLMSHPDWYRGQTQHWTEASIKKNLSGNGHIEYKKRKAKERETKRMEVLRIRELNKKRGLIWINNGKNNLRVYKDELEKYQNDGWTIGFISHMSEESKQHIIDACHKARGKINVTVCGRKTKVRIEQLDEFMENNPDTIIGWPDINYKMNNIGSSGYKWMNKDGIYKYIAPDIQSKYELNGWKYGYKNVRSIKNTK